MSNDPSPLKYMGTQSQETLNMAAAMALAAEANGKPSGAVDDASCQAVSSGSKIGDAASWVVGKAKDTLQSAAGQVRGRAMTAVKTYTKDDPVRAILIAAGAGALLMGVVSMLARSGVRTARHYFQR